MQRKRIVDIRANPAILKEGPQFVPLRAANYVLVKNVLLAGKDRRHLQGSKQSCIQESSGIGRGIAPARLIPFIEIAELYPQDGSLNLIQPAIEADDRMVVFRFHSMSA